MTRPFAHASIVIALSLAVLVPVLMTATADADVLIRLKDGRTIRVPVDAAEVAGIEFEKTTQPASEKETKAAPSVPPVMSRDTPLGAQVLSVGPGKLYPTPSAAAKVAKDGDIIEISAGIYRGDVARWRQNNLTLRGVGGKVQLLAAGRSSGGKAIWVIRGNNTRVENISFSGARVPHGNGAGIRLEGSGLVIDNCEFTGNQMGILAGSIPDSNVVIRNSRFVGNRVEGKRPLGHNVYIGNVNTLTMENNHVEGAVHGHNVKSRARVTTLINNRIIDGPEGASSYLVDMAAGGIGVMRDNYLEQGDRAENFTLVSYGAERQLHPENRLLIVNNRFVNKSHNGTFVRNHSDAPAELIGNSIEGSGTVLRGPGTVIGR